jgi:S-(hydroxymethyl)glutathione dehydrogenase/alcohol dehydrogenase
MSDEHMRHGDVTPRFPIIGGHEGAGHVLEVGPGVTRVEPGDAVVCTFIPSCGTCRWCVTGQQALCDLGAAVVEGCLPGGRFVYHRDGQDYGALGSTASFSQYATLSESSVIKVDPDLPLETICIVGCGVPTGWGSAVYAADVRPGETVIVVGTGGVGINAVQGAALAGAKHVIAVDRAPKKREVAAQVGASHVAASIEEARVLVLQLTDGIGAEKVIITVDLIQGDLVNQALAALAKAGTLVLTSWADFEKHNMSISTVELTAYNKRIQGAIYGHANPLHDIPRLLDLYRSGDLKLDELVTTTYALEDINQAYADLADGKNVRGVIVHDHS